MEETGYNQQNQALEQNLFSVAENAETQSDFSTILKNFWKSHPVSAKWASMASVYEAMQKPHEAACCKAIEECLPVISASQPLTVMIEELYDRLVHGNDNPNTIEYLLFSHMPTPQKLLYLDMLEGKFSEALHAARAQVEKMPESLSAQYILQEVEAVYTMMFNISVLRMFEEEKYSALWALCFQRVQDYPEKGVFMLMQEIANRVIASYTTQEIPHLDTQTHPESPQNAHDILTALMGKMAEKECGYL